MEILGIYNSKQVTQAPNNKAKDEIKAQKQNEPMYRVGGEAEVYTGEGIKIKLGAPLAEVRRAYIEGTIKRFGGDKDRAAAALGIKRDELERKISEGGN